MSLLHGRDAHMKVVEMMAVWLGANGFLHSCVTAQNSRAQMWSKLIPALGLNSGHPTSVFVSA
jgi:hypothetical protein